MSTAQTIADLKAARAALIARGRCRGHTIDPDGSVCIIGALGVAAVDGFEQMEPARRQAIRMYNPRVAAVYEALSEHIPTDESSLYLYSDELDTTDQDVLDLFDKTLADLGGLA